MMLSALKPSYVIQSGSRYKIVGVSVVRNLGQILQTNYSLPLRSGQTGRDRKPGPQQTRGRRGGSAWSLPQRGSSNPWRVRQEKLGPTE